MATSVKVRQFGDDKINTEMAEKLKAAIEKARKEKK